MRLFRPFIFIGFIFSAVTANSESAAKAESKNAVTPAQMVDAIVAKVNHEIITLFKLRKAAIPMNGGNMPSLEDINNPERKQFYKGLLEQLIVDRLILQEADKLQYTIPEDQVDGWIRRVQGQNGWDASTFERVLEQQGVSLTDYRQTIRDNLRKRRLLQVKINSKINVSQQEVDEVFANDFGASGSQIEINASHILLTIAANASQNEVESILDRAHTIRTKALGGTPFKELAEEFSEGPSKNNGGSLGWFKRGTMDEMFETTAFDLKDDEISNPVRTRFGFHIIKKIKSRAAPIKDKDSIEDRIRERLRTEQRNRYQEQWLTELRRKAYVIKRMFQDA